MKHTSEQTKAWLERLKAKQPIKLTVYPVKNKSIDLRKKKSIKID